MVRDQGAISLRSTEPKREPRGLSYRKRYFPSHYEEKSMRILALIVFAYCMVYVALNLSGCTADTDIHPFTPNLQWED
jgi:hypothetical protein